MNYDQLKLANQVCFPLYAASRLVTREYQPHLEELKITYPQYLVLLVLWEFEKLPVNDIAQKLYLNTNTITPLIKRMESQGLLSREKLPDDERKVYIGLTKMGRSLQEKAAKIPEKLAGALAGTKLALEEVVQLRDTLNLMIEVLNQEKNS